MKNTSGFLLVAVVIFQFLLLPEFSEGAWIWTRESGRFRNVNDITKENAREQLEYAESFEKTKDFKSALREYKKTVKHFPTSPEAATATFRMGVCYEELGNADKAFNAYREVLDKYPSFPHPQEVLRRQFAISKAYYEGKRRPLPFVKLGLFKARGAAIDYFNKIVETAPYSDLAPDAKLLAAELQERKKNFDEAIKSCEFVVEHYPRSEAAETALFKIGSCHYQKALRARHDERSISLASTNFRSYVEKYPNGKYAKEAREKLMSLDDKRAKGVFEVGRFYEKKKKFPSALLYYTEVVQRHPLSAWAVKAEERIKSLKERGLAKEEAATAS
jgi:outer membrane protein assembly factor BamD